MMIFSGHYEFGPAEVSKAETDLTKASNDGSVKLANTMKAMLVSLANCCPPIQHDIKIVGMLFSGLKVGFFKTSNPDGYVCVMKKTFSCPQKSVLEENEAACRTSLGEQT